MSPGFTAVSLCGGRSVVRGTGLRVESLARIASMSVEDGVKFVGEA
ncbi:MAG: hypothetical protein IKK25_05615 [Lentisphaeria bacterium]|nr:hypothetical protein [Lentisphaeria bacterium]